MKLKSRKIRVLISLVALVLLASVPLATRALAAPAAVVASITGDPSAPGETDTFTFTITPTQRTLDSFTLSPPANWQLTGTPSPSSFQIVGNTLVGSSLGVSGSGSATVQFQANTGCKGGDWAWGLEAFDSQGRNYSNGTSDLTTNVDGDCTLAITNQPKDAVKTTLITGTPFTPSTNFVQVELLNGAIPAQRVIYFPVDVTFDLATGAGLASGALSAATVTTVNGVATFSANDAALSIGTTNEPEFTDYRLSPKTVNTVDRPYGGLTGAASTGFDIWDAACSGLGCETTLRGDNPRGGADVYRTHTNTVLSTSTLDASTLAIECPGQKVIFQNDVFVHETSSSSDPVFVTSTITVADFRAAGTNYGQANVEWCVGIKPGDAAALGNGGTYTGVNLDADPEFDLFVGFAPRCPIQSPWLSAPCIVSQMSDGMKGSITTGYLQGGDPPRRT